MIRCSGLQIGPIAVPPFEVFNGESVGLALEAEYGASWYELLQVLGGEIPHPAVSVAAKTALIVPPMLEPRGASKQPRSVYEHLLTEGIVAEAASSLLRRVRLSADDNVESLQLTAWLLFKIEISWTMGAPLVVFSSSGLDPNGLATIFREVSLHLAGSSVLDLFSIHSGQPTRWYNRIVRCPAI